MKPILNIYSLTENSFQRCSYNGLFKEVNGSIGNYISTANQKYLTFMIDFMNTINNLNSERTQVEYDFLARTKRPLMNSSKDTSAIRQKYFQTRQKLLLD